MKTLHIALSCLFLVLASAEFSARETKQLNDEPAEGKTDPDQLRKTANVSFLIQQLDHDDFKKREAAGEELRAMGKLAIPVLVEVVDGNCPESSMRAFKIIADHYKNGDGGARESAAEALQKIMESNKIFSGRAKQVMEPQKPVPRFGQRLNLKVAGKVGAPVRVAVTIKNGVKQVDAKEGDRHVKILDDPEKGITVEVSEEKAGKKEIKKYESENVDKLKQKHPEACKLYQQYVGNGRAKNGNIRIQIKPDAP